MSSATPSVSPASEPTPVKTSDDDRRAAILSRYRRTRQFTETLVEPLAPEDYVIQTMTDASPAKWHLAHTSWFFERFILQDHQPGYQAYAQPYYFLFNSYYNTIGPQHCRNHRGLISRPTVPEVYTYRRVIDERLTAFVETCDDEVFATIEPLIHIGCQHEQQHQELIVTDIKHTLSSNPLLPGLDRRGVAGATQPRETVTEPGAMRWIGMDEGQYEIGHARPTGVADWCFDNETPRHRIFLEAFELADRPVTNREFLAFIEDDGYRRCDLWLSLGWSHINEHGHTHPIYWFQDGQDDPDGWRQYTLDGPRPLNLDEPVCHISYFEADAFARWAGARLPTECEWEAAAQAHDAQAAEGHFADTLALHPRQATPPPNGGERPVLRQLFGDVWEWTASSYSPYPGFEPLPGALGEYNGKFMCNQYVLRGGSCATPAGHIRPTYRNFFAPESRWQFAGLRLARS